MSEGAQLLEAELASIPAIPPEVEGPCIVLGASRPLGDLDEPDCYEPPHVSPRLRRRGDSRLDGELNEPWD